jgi:quercetin dioxygenase-like cupin family protein
MQAIDLASQPLHLDAECGVQIEPPWSGGLAWYEAYAARHAGDGAAGRLVSYYRFDAPWQSWEMHPLGDELVLCTEGRMTLIQQTGDGGVERIELAAGQVAINRAGVWHTADVDSSACALFVTAGMGTQHRPR